MSFRRQSLSGLNKSCAPRILIIFLTLVDPAAQPFAAIKPRVVMTIVFTGPNDFVETVHNNNKEDPTVLEAILDNDLLESGKLTTQFRTAKEVSRRRP